MSEPLRVLTLNTWNREGPYAQRAPLIRAWVQRLQPHVLGFQEVLEDQVGELLADLGYAHVWHGHGPSGMAIATRWSIEEAHAVDLPGRDGNVGGIAQCALVAAPFGTIPFVNTTSYFPGPHEGVHRERQIPALHAAIRALRKRDRYPPVIVGDFNTEPESAEMRFMRGLQSIDGQSAWYCDAWERAGQGTGATWTRRNAYSAPWGLPDRRIDYVYVGSPGVTGPGAVLHCSVVCDTPVDGAWPSDHFGVFAVLGVDP